MSSWTSLEPIPESSVLPPPPPLALTVTVTITDLQHSGVVMPPIRPQPRRRTRRSSRSSSQEVNYTGQENRKFRVQGDPLYLAPSSSGNSLHLEAQESTSHTHVCFRVHTFEVLRPLVEGGIVVMLETFAGGKFLRGATSGTLSLMSGGISVNNVSRFDNRFFLLHSARGDTYVTIKHLATGHFLSRGTEQVTLVNSDQGITDDMRFEMFDCTRS
ncbi:hypothetical protein Hamer_G022084 [Homarus americanus]|uniref:Uncharacterized protein n=1 Tax=Homarus americanus TaxID=6706 RepID=A0A8J5MQD6_HOMAM|nr:hypothetical protein Hamer_G022084 [Homarus americanus]